jgi:hypothetical protein
MHGHQKIREIKYAEEKGIHQENESMQGQSIDQASQH